MVPHPIPYQGSKRKLAKDICHYIPKNVGTLYEPFAGSAAITLYCAQHNLAERFVIGDALPSLVELWQMIVNKPEQTADQYELLWDGQQQAGPEYFNKIRDRFNGDHDPVELLYLVARCVKNAVRFNAHGKMTQSVDKRRLGMRPEKMRQAVFRASQLLRGRTEFFAGDFLGCLESAKEGDFVYLDPPYQGTTYGKDKRYFSQVEREHLYGGLQDLNDRNIPFLLSYDGVCGDVVYGEELPDYLNIQRIFLHAGRSTQATLSGRVADTVESLYLSKGIAAPRLDHHRRSVAVQHLVSSTA
ncbi:MAG: Dam family site-specific DNA-(adenine-N6)-methyltransferase [Methylobacter sp.]